MKPGPHSITVGDENGCTNLTQNFFVIGYPKFFSPNGEEWDGNYIEQLLPAADYWFTVEFSEKSETKLFKAHFSLIQ